MQVRYDVLEAENKKNVDTIKKLEMQVCSNGMTKPIVDMNSQSCQTFFDDILISCNLCIFVATCEEELNYHMYDGHDLSDDSHFDRVDYCKICRRWCNNENELKIHMEEHQVVKVCSRTTNQNYDSESNSTLFNCNFCEETFGSTRNLMTHKKKHHEHKLAPCRNFSAGNCHYGEALCWFSHNEGVKNAETREANCNICGKTFSTLNHYLQHKKLEHETTVRECRNDMNNQCRFGDKNCWFIHIKETNLEKKENQQITEQIFGMMETFTKRILELENNINDKN